MEMKMSRELDAPAATVWHLVGERFGDLSWVETIRHSELEGELGAGAVRVCHFEPSMLSKTGVVREKLLAFDREQMSLSYEAEPTGPMTRAVNRWRVTSLSPGRCRVEMHATVELSRWFRLVAPLLRGMLRRLGAQTLEDLALAVAEARYAA